MAGCGMVRMLERMVGGLQLEPSIEDEEAGNEPDAGRPKESSIHERVCSEAGNCALAAIRSTVV